MKIDDKEICEKILSFYKNNVELKDNLTAYEKGYLRCLTDINLGRYNLKKHQ